MLNEILEVIQKTLVDGDSVQLVGFGTFSITARASREGRNPATGKPLIIPAKKVIKFKAGKTLADAAAGKPKKTNKKK